MKVLYAIGPSPEGPTKIGIANSLSRRLEDLQGGCWEKLHLGYFGAFYLPGRRGRSLGLGEVFATSEQAARTLEGSVHHKLKELGFHIRGEWFDVSFSDAGKAIEKIAEQAGAVPLDGEDFKKYIELYGPKHPGNKSGYKELNAFIRSLQFGHEAVRRCYAQASIAAE